MGAAAYSRGNKVISDQTQSDLSNPAIEHRALRAEIGDLRRELREAKVNLERAELRIRERAATLTAERISHAEEMRRAEEDRRTWIRFGFRMERRWRWVSRIVRAYVSPAQVAEFRRLNP